MGAANELLTVLFFLTLAIQSGYVLIKFASLSDFGILTKIMMFLINGYVCVGAFWEFFTFLMMVQIMIFRITVLESRNSRFRTG